MNQKEFENVLRIPAPERYEYFIKKVADSEEVWGLFDDGWATTEDGNGNTLVPFWPKKEFAQVCATHDWNNYSPKSIDLTEFIESWLPGMRDDGYKPSIFWNLTDSAVVDIEVLLNDLNTELQKY